jgi:hypothetical protein
MMEELSSSETSVLTRATRRNILEGAILETVFVEASLLAKYSSRKLMNN